MKKNWFWPLVLILVIIGLLVIAGIYMAVKTFQSNNTLEIDQRIKQHTVTLDGKVTQKLGFYYLKPAQKEPVMMHVQLGEYVQKGDPLYTYVDEKLNNLEREIELQLDNKRVEKEQIEGQIVSYETARDNATKDSDIERIDAQLNWLNAELTKAENNVSIMEEKQKKISAQKDALTVKAGADGEVLNVDEEQLQRFTSNEQNKPVVTLGVEHLNVEGLAGRYAVLFMEPNLKVDVTAKDVSDTTYKGNIESVEKTPQSHLQQGDIEESLTSEAPTTEEPSKGKKEVPQFKYTAILDRTNHLYDGDLVRVKVYLSYKNHIWLPKKFVQQKTTVETRDGQKEKQRTYYVNKVYGQEVKKEMVTVEKTSGGQYLVTKGLSTIDTLRSFK